MENEILEKVALVQIDISIWSGRKKLRPEDIRLGDGGALPPETVASLGSKKVIGREALKTFETLKKRAQRLPEEIGVRFLGGYAVPVERAQEVSDHLKKVQAEFEEARTEFLDNYSQLIEEWIAENPDFAESLRRAVPPKEYVGRATDFRFAIFQVTPAKAESGLGSQATGLGGQLLEEVAVDARRWMERHLASASEASRRTLRPLLRIRNKLDALAFLSGAAQPLVEAIDEVLGECGRMPVITGGPLVRLKAMAGLLAEPTRSQQVLDASVVRKEIDGMWAPAAQETHPDTSFEWAEEDGEAEAEAEADAFEAEPDESPERKDAEEGAPDLLGPVVEEEEDEAEQAESGFWF
ncbi:MAG TPA: DUF3150 domain-containing protein [Rariglobus sp.]